MNGMGGTIALLTGYLDDYNGYTLLHGFFAMQVSEDDFTDVDLLVLICLACLYF